MHFWPKPARAAGVKWKGCDGRMMLPSSHAHIVRGSHSLLLLFDHHDGHQLIRPLPSTQSHPRPPGPVWSSSARLGSVICESSSPDLT